MKKYLILFLVLMCGVSTSSYANKKNVTSNGYKIDISAPQLKNDTVNLAMYFYGKLYSRDTTVLNAQGYGSFTRNNKKLEEGMYVVYFSGSRYFDLLVADDQYFSIRIDTTDLINNVVVSGAEQTEKFSEYMKFISQKREESTRMMKQYESTKNNPETKQIIDEKIKEFDKAVTDYQQNIVDAYKGKTLGVIMKSLMPMHQPTDEELQAENDSIRQIKRYYYNREHFFDNYDLSDPRLLRTGFLPPKINFYIEKMLPQSIDTINTEIVKLVEKSRGDSLTFQNMLSNMLNYAIKSNVMGMDRVLLTLSEKYYLSGMATWADSTLIKDLTREVKKIKYTQLGDPAHNLKVETIDGQKTSLYAQPQDYILIYFYEPTCGHCKKETPLLYKDVFKKYEGYENFFQVFAFYIQVDRQEWEDFVNKNELTDWLNVWDPDRESYFWHFYDTSTTPGLYLINKDRKFIAKKVDLDTLDRILQDEMRRNGNY